MQTIPIGNQIPDTSCNRVMSLYKYLLFGKRYLMYLFLCALPLLCHSNPQVSNYIQEIPEEFSVRAIEKVPQGLMWLGTNHGLRTFDGYQYQKIGNELDSIPVLCLMVDVTKKTLWIGTQNGLYVIDYISHGIQKKYPKKETVLALLKRRKDGTVFAAYCDGTLLSINTNNQIRTINIPELINNQNVSFLHNILADDNNGILFYSVNGSKKLYLLTLPDEKTHQLNTGALKVPTYLERFGDTIILGTWGGGVSFFNRKTLRNTTPSWLVSLNEIYGLNGFQHCFLSGDTLYVYFANANIWVIDLKTGHYHKFWDNSAAITDRDIENSFYVDPYQVLWIGRRSGMLKSSNDYHWFERHITASSGLSDKPNSIREIIADKNGDLYAGSYSGLFHYAAAKEKWEIFPKDSNQKLKNEIIPGALLNDTTNDYIYIASELHFFYRFNKKNGIFETNFFKCTGDTGFFKQLEAFTFLKDIKGKIWMGTNKGLASYNPLTQELKPGKSNSFDIGSYTVTYLKQSGDSNIIWVVSEGGLYKLDINGGIVARFHTGSKPALSKNKIYCAEEDKKGNLWVGTDGGGVNILNPSLKTVRSLNTLNSSLCDNVIYSLLWENDTIIWFSTKHGLSRFNIPAERFTNYYIEDGLCSNEFNRNSFFKDSKGKMYAGGIAGITAFYPAKMQEQFAPLHLFVSKISTWDSQLDKEIIYKITDQQKMEIILQPQYIGLNISIGLSDYAFPERNHYYYRIKGESFNDNWIAMGRQHILKLEGLHAGKYAIELKGMNAKGVAANKLHFELYVKFPFYQRWWFYVLSTIALIGILYCIYRLRILYFKKLEQQRMHIASDLHDEIGSIITHINIYSTSLNENYIDEKEKRTRINKLIDTSSSLSTSMRDVLWDIDTRNDTASDLADHMRAYVSNLLRTTDISLRFDAGAIKEHVKIPAHTKLQLRRIFKEAINNCIKHSNASYIEVLFHYKANKFTLVIKNDGVNTVKKDEYQSGQGLRNIKMRAHQINATMTFNQSEDQFTLIVDSVQK